MQAPLYNQDGKEIKKIDLPLSIFGVDVNFDLVHQVAVCQASNKRQGSAHTKDRSEVRGGGKKPWKQKGTGRARHGSIRSPLWKGGGATFGPRNEKNYKKIIPEKMRKKALSMTLSGKFKDNEIIFVDEIKLNDSKTKSIKKIIDCFPINSGKALILCPKNDKNIILGSKNIPKLKTMLAKDINVFALLSFKFLIIPEESIEVIKSTFSL